MYVTISIFPDRKKSAKPSPVTIKRIKRNGRFDTYINGVLLTTYYIVSLVR